MHPFKRIGKTKRELAEQIFLNCQKRGFSRKQTIREMAAMAQLAPSSAATYYQTFKKHLDKKEPVVQRVVISPPPITKPTEDLTQRIERVKTFGRGSDSDFSVDIKKNDFLDGIVEVTVGLGARRETATCTQRNVHARIIDLKRRLRKKMSHNNSLPHTYPYNNRMQR